MAIDRSNEDTELFERWHSKQIPLSDDAPRTDKKDNYTPPKRQQDRSAKHIKAKKQKKKRSKKPLFIIIAIVLFAAGVLLGWYLQSGAFSGSGVLSDLGKLNTGSEISANLSNPIPDLADQAMDSVVSVTMYRSGERQGRGSGFVLTYNGYIATNYHVVSAGDSIEAEFNDGTILDAEYIGGDATADVALIKVNSDTLKPISLGDSDTLRAGDQVFAIGDPQGMGVNLSRSVTVGYVSSAAREITYNDETQTFIQTDTALNPGNSGGPLINTSGQVIGMVTLKSLVSTMDASGEVINADGISFAIPINKVVELVQQASKDYEDIEFKPGLGLYYAEVTEDIRSETGQDNMPAGLYVAGFMGGGNAAAAGVEVGDVITSINGISTTEQDDVSQIINSSNEGDKLNCAVWRDGETLEISIPVGNYNRMREVMS